MNHKIANSLIAAALALSAVPTMAQKGNTSETRPAPTAEVTRTERGSTQYERRTDGEWMWVNYRTGDVMFAMSTDMESKFAAEMGVDMMTDPATLEEAGFEYDGTFRVRGVTGCYGVNAYLDFDPVYFVVCADGTWLNVVMGTDKQDALDIAEQLQDGDEPEAPAGYRAEEVD